MKWIDEKMKLLGCTTNPNYKLAFYLDSRAMISVQTEKYGLVDVKPLGVVWGKFEMYNKKNTIMFDDLRRNFLMNPQNGLKIRPFREVTWKYFILENFSSFPGSQKSRYRQGVSWTGEVSQQDRQDGGFL